MSQESRNDELNNEKIIKYSNYKSSTKETISNSSKEEYSIINLALMLSYEKKLKNIIANVKKELHDNIEIKNVLEVNIKDNKTGKTAKLNIPYGDQFQPDKDDPTSAHYNILVNNENN